MKWKLFFPLLRCPACRRWLVLRSRADLSLTLATKEETERMRGDSPPSP